MKPERIPALCGERVSKVAACYVVSCAVTWRGDLWRWGQWGQVQLNDPTPLKGTLLDSQRVVSISMSLSPAGEQHCFALTADGAVLSWVVDCRNSDLKHCRHVLVHGGALDAHRSRFSEPRPIEALAGQRVCSLATNILYTRKLQARLAKNGFFFWPPFFQYNKRLLRQKTGGACLYMPQDGH